MIPSETNPFTKETMMLLGIDPESCFPVDEIAFLAFRLAAKETFAQLVAQQDRDPGQADEHVGYLGEVELLQPLKTAAQVRLLSDAWRLHTSPVVHQATFLEASVLCAACKTAADLIRADRGRRGTTSRARPDGSIRQ